MRIDAGVVAAALCLHAGVVAGARRWGHVVLVGKGGPVSAHVTAGKPSTDVQPLLLSGSNE